MLRLTLVRHAKAEPARAGQEDWDRALDPQGQKEAVEIGLRLHQRALKPNSLVSSSALRAISTASLLARELGFPSKSIFTDERLYLVSASALLEWIREGDWAARHPTQHLMIVAHNPGLSEFAAHIAVSPIVDSLGTSAAYTLQFEIEHWCDLRWSSGINAELESPQRRD